MPNMPNDSISRYDSSGDRFNLYAKAPLRDPVEVLNSPKLSNRDTLQSAKESMESEILNRLQVNINGIPNNKLPVLAWAGKYIFMAVAVPTYLLTYALPKWLAVHLLPKTCQLLAQSVKHSFSAFYQMLLHWVQRMERLLKVFKSYKHKVTQLQSFFSQLQQRFRAVREKITNLRKKGTAHLSQVKQALQTAVNSAYQKIERYLAVLGQKSRNQLKKLVFGRVSNQDPLPQWRQTVIHWALAAQQLYRRFRALPGKALFKTKQTLLELYQKHIGVRLEAVRKSLNDFKARTGKGFQSLINPCKRFVDKQTEKISKLLKKISQSTQESVKKMTSVFTFVQDLPKKLVEVWSGMIQSPLLFLQNTRLKFSHFTHQSKQKLSRALGAVASSVMGLKQSFFKRIREKRFSTANIRKKAEELFKKLLQKTHRIIAKMKQLGERRPRPTFAFKKYVKKIKAKTKQVIYYTRLSRSWIRILFGFWCVAVRAICDDFIERLTWEDFVRFIRSLTRSHRKAA